MNMQKPNLRCGTAEDVECIFEVMVKAFRVEENSSTWHSWHNRTINNPERFRVLEVGGRIVGIASITRFLFWVGECEITHGDVGEVSVLPEFQGNGYGSALMRDVVQWMRDSGYDISRLGGYSVFYRRFGYVPFPRRHVEFPIEPVHAGATIISAEEMFRLPEGLPGMIRPYDASRDAIRKDELYQIFNRGRSGSVVRHFNPNAELPRTPSPADPLRIVYEVDGVVEGYLFAGDGGVSIYEVAFNPSLPDAFVGLVKQILHVAAENGVKSVISRLPFDATVLSILTRWNIAFNLYEHQGGYASNMIQILNLESLLRKITPELESRLRASFLADSRCEIEVGFESQSVGLRVRDGNIATGVEVSDGSASMQTDQATLMKLIYGMLSFEEAPVIGRESIEPLEAAILSTLFPRQHTASGGWG